MSKAKEEFCKVVGHRVSTHFDPKTGKVVLQMWTTEKGGIDRIDGPAWICIDPKTDVVYREEWQRNDKYHRVGGPAIIDRDRKTGIVVYEEWRQDGIRHRLDGPAMIERDRLTGSVVKEWWRKHGSRVWPKPVVAVGSLTASLEHATHT